MNLAGKIANFNHVRIPDLTVNLLAIGLQSAFYYYRYYYALRTMEGEGIFS